MMRTSSGLNTFVAWVKTMTAAAVMIGFLGGCCIFKHHHEGGHANMQKPVINPVVFLDNSQGTPAPKIMIDGKETDTIPVIKTNGASIKFSGTNDFILIFPERNPNQTGKLEIEPSHNGKRTVTIDENRDEGKFKYTLVILQSYGTNVIPWSADPFIIIRPY